MESQEMPEALQESLHVSPERVRAQLENILLSVTFSQAYRLRNFLQFIVECALGGQYDRLKETSIGVAVFEKSASFDPREEPIVRVEARRLRTKLHRYYETEGVQDAIVIHLPKGAYVPFFEVRDTPDVPDTPLIEEKSSEYLEVVHVNSISTLPIQEDSASPSKVSQSTPAVLWVVVILLFAIALLPSLSTPKGPNHKTESEHIVPLTTFSGKEFNPAISPDGKQVSFVWDGESGNNYDIYVKLLNVGTPIRLTTSPAYDLHPAWSPDGRYIAFLRIGKDQSEVLSIPSLGGTERKITDLHLSSMMWRSDPIQRSQSPGPIWSKDGQSLIVSDGLANAEAIFLIPMNGEPRKQITFPPGVMRDLYPSLSPDGRTIAFARQTSEASSDIYIVSMTGGEPRKLTSDRMDVRGITWKNDGSSIIFSSNRVGSNYGLWEIAVNGGMPLAIPVSAEQATDPFISPLDGSLAYTDTLENTNIWRQRIGKGSSQKEQPERFIYSSRRNSSPRYSPDGSLIAFTSDRSGFWEIWTSNSNGTNPQQITSFAGAMVGSPNWSPDGRSIIFDARPNGRSIIYTVPSTGGLPKALTADDFENKMPSFSNDGKWIYFASSRNGSIQMWKMPAQGGAASQITSMICRDPFESPDGHRVLFEGREQGIWQVSTTGGSETVVPGLEDIYPSRYMTIARDAIYFVNSGMYPRFIQRYLLDSHHIETIGVIDKELVDATRSLTVSPDLKWVVYAQQDQSSSDLMLLKNF